MVRGCADARMRGCSGEIIRLYSVWIIIITMYMLVSMPHLRRCSPHVKPFGDCLVM